MKSHDLHVIVESNAEQLPDSAAIAAAAETVLSEICRRCQLPAAFELAVHLIDDERMQTINREQRGKDTTTDVLSFPILDFPAGTGPEGLQRTAQGLADLGGLQALAPPGEALLLGDVLISTPTCLRQAQSIGHSPADEFWRLMVHGILHLFGYDHETNDADARRMQALEDELLALLPDAAG